MKKYDFQLNENEPRTNCFYCYKKLNNNNNCNDCNREQPCDHYSMHKFSHVGLGLYRIECKKCYGSWTYSNLSEKEILC